ncbi:MAG: flavin reductase family protein [Acidobacteriia bacterium]|nr:flavin reductase family protein [Terriglobia bacterium]
MVTEIIKNREIDFKTITPSILYFGNPVAIVSSINPDGSPNLAPISSFWGLGWTMVLGQLSDTQTLDDLQRQPDCVVNVPSPDLWEAVERLAPLTGKNPVPPEKSAKFRFPPDKFVEAGLTPLASESVRAPRVKECPVQLEATVSHIHTLQGEPRLDKLGGGAAVEVRILKAHVRADFVLRENYVNPEKWQPLIYNFRHYFGLGAQLGKTFRAEI